MSYAIISLGGKQYVVKEGQKLLVDRLPHAESKTFHPDVIFAGGDGTAEIAPKGFQVTARVLAHTRGEKIRIGKYRAKSGYRRHNGFRSALTQIQIEKLGKSSSRTTAKKDDAPAEAKPARATKTEAENGA